MANKMKEEFYGHLDRLSEGKLPFAVWGAGASGKNTLKKIEEYTSGAIFPSVIVDNNPAMWEDGKVISSEKFFKEHEKYDTVFVCVYVADQVVCQLMEGGYKGVIFPFIPNVMETKNSLNFYYNNTDNISRLKEILSDDISKKTIDTLIKVGETGDISLWEGINGKSDDKLLEMSILKLSDDEILTDVGAFIGDSIERFIELTKGKYKKIIALEPDPKNYKNLVKTVSKYKKVETFNAGAYDEDKKISFMGGLSESGGISQNGNITVDAIRLDTLDVARDSSFIKISTNGYDYHVIKGSENIIRKNQPKLSYYCSGNLLWDIPFLLKEWVSDYKFYVRHYGIGMQAMIGYAVRKD